MRWLVVVALLTSGCAAIPAALALDALVGAVGIYQRYEDRQTQQEQTAEIKALREEIARLRARWPQE